MMQETNFELGNSNNNLVQVERDELGENVKPKAVRQKAKAKSPLGIPSSSQKRRAETDAFVSAGGLLSPTNANYRNTFEELGELGKGGFGSVVKVRHLIDGEEYAVKKIRFWNKKMESHLREVRALARVNRHANIVCYHNVTLEPSGCDSPKPPSEDGSGSQSYPSSQDSENSNYDAGKDPKLSSGADNFSYLGVRRKFNIAVRLDDSMDENENGEAMDSSDSDELAAQESGNDNDVGDDLPVALTMYIQMELCRSSLKEWLAERNARFPDSLYVDPPSSSVNNHIFRQIFEGVTFIHSKGLMHRDMKPPNILLDGDNHHVKIADFGLVKELVQKHSKEVFVGIEPVKEDEHTIQLGTPPYVSPEQFYGPSYTKKTDLFSIGIMLYEVYHTWGSDTEKSKGCQELKEGYKCCDNFRKEWPQVAEIVDLLIHKDPVMRPEASKMLDHHLFLSREQQMQKELAALKEQLAMYRAAGVAIRE